jgi:hypothetical protein
MHKLYKKTQEKIDRLKLSVAVAYRERKDPKIADKSRSHFFLLNLELVWLEFIFNLIKLLIILAYDSGTVFKIFYQTNAREACFFPYESFKIIHKKIRVFSCVAIIVAVSAALMTSFSGVSAWR